MKKLILSTGVVIVTTVILVTLAIILFGCTKAGGASARSTNVPDVYKKIYGATEIYSEGGVLVIKCKGLPDHKSPYYTNSGDTAKYEAYSGTNPAFMKAMGEIDAYSYTFTIPLSPQPAAKKQATAGGPIGLAINGVPFFNQYNGMGQPLGPMEYNTYDQYNGHPNPDNAYHYHAEPLYLTANKGKDALLGFLLDGYPVYGPMENGKAITNDSLDAYHGHFGATADYPGGIYHYHITSADPYLNGDGYYGSPGTVSF